MHCPEGRTGVTDTVKLQGEKKGNLSNQNPVRHEGVHSTAGINYWKINSDQTKSANHETKQADILKAKVWQ